MRRLFVALGTAIPVAAGLSFAPVAHAADAVCFASTQFGLSCVNASGIKSYARGKELPIRSISDMKSCGDKIVIAGSSQIILFDGEKFEAPVRASAGASKVSCDGKGGIWATGYRGVSYWDGSGWKSWSKDDVAQGEKSSYMTDLAAGPDGTVWVIVGGRSLAHYDGKAWKLYKEGAGLDQRYYMSRIVFADGAPMIPHSRGVLTFKDGKWSNIPGPRGSRIDAGRDGTLWITGSRTITAMKDGKFREVKGPNYSIWDATSDAKGRLWIATSFGIGLYEDGKWVMRQMNNSDIIDNRFTYVVAIGNGGAMPAEVEKKSGSLRGRLEWQSGDPVANAEIAICGVSKFFFRTGTSPCDGQPLAKMGKTDEDGKFTFDSVPPAVYRIYLKAKQGRWYGIISLSRRTRVEAEDKKNAGTIRISDRIKPEK